MNQMFGREIRKKVKVNTKDIIYKTIPKAKKKIYESEDCL